MKSVRAGFDRPSDGQTDGWTDTARCRVACPRLERNEGTNHDEPSAKEK